jgi:hypothetical protein
LRDLGQSLNIKFAPSRARLNSPHAPNLPSALCIQNKITIACANYTINWRQTTKSPLNQACFIALLLFSELAGAKGDLQQDLPTGQRGCDLSGMALSKLILMYG